MSKHLLILDLDEVLVYSTEDTSVPLYDFEISRYRVCKRPYVDEFLDAVFEMFETAIWTSATEDYAKEMVNQLFPNPTKLKFLWSRKRCTLRFDPTMGEHYWVKDLKKVKRRGFKLEEVLVLEDNPRTMERSYGNLIEIRPFLGGQFDRELKDLIEYLNWISAVENVRVIEKRAWRSFTHK